MKAIAYIYADLARPVRGDGGCGEQAGAFDHGRRRGRHCRAALRPFEALSLLASKRRLSQAK